MIRCVIIDDEQPAISIIKKYIVRIPNLELVGTETNPLAGIEIIKKQKADLVFLDIQMDEMSGIEVMKIVGNTTKVIFCTAFSEFAVTSYDLEAADYLMKPIKFNRFLKAVQRVSNMITNQPAVNDVAIPGDYIFIKAGQRGKMQKIDLDDIDFVEAMNNYIAFHCGTQKTLAYLTMKELEERLPGNQFMRIHKSYIIALKQIASVENNQLILKKTLKRIPIGINYKEAFIDKMKSKLMN